MYFIPANNSAVGRLLVSVLLLCCCQLAMSSTSSPGGRPPKIPAARPPFLSHLTDDDLKEAMQIAKRRHQIAVSQALSNYPVDDNDVGGDDDSSSSSTVVIEPAKRMGTIHASPLPDFDNELPKAVYVTDPPLFSPEECQEVIQMAENHFATAGEWSTQTSGQYQMAGFYIKQVPAVHEWFVKTVKTRLFPLLQRTFPEFVGGGGDGDDDDNDNADSLLCVDQSYLFKYTTETGRRTDVHTDSGCLSFTIALNDEYTGGGTWFQGLDTDTQILEMKQGQVTVRPGGVKHCGNAIESGTRYIIGGFCMHRKKPEIVRMLLCNHLDGEDNSCPNQRKQLALEAAVALNPSCDAAYSLLANHYETVLKDKKKAQQVLEYCMEHATSQSGEVAYALASLYLDQNEYAKAENCLQTCLQVDPGDVDALLSLAQCAAARGDADQERALYQRIVDTPTGSNSVLAQAYCNLGVLQEGTDAEIECYIKSLALLKKFSAQYSLACAYASRQDWNQAVDSFKKSVELAEEDDKATLALQQLYKAAAYLVRKEMEGSGSSSQSPPSPQAMTEKFQNIMGADNFAKLAAMSGRR